MSVQPRRIFKGSDGSELIHGRIWHQAFSGASTHSLKYYDGAPVRFWRRGREVSLDGHSFLLVNAGEDYAFEVPAPKETRVTAAFFTSAQVSGAWRSLTAGSTVQLDDPEALGELRELSCCLHRARPHLSRFLAAFRAERGAGGVSPQRLDEILGALLTLCLAPEVDLARARRSFSPDRPAQREEVLRRISQARAFIEANAERDLCLEDSARAACLSKFYFLRRFKAVLGCTPSEFHRRVRLERAAEAILKGRLLTEIALEAGYADLAAFSRGFRRRYGVAPSAYRQKSNAGQAARPAL